MSKKVIIGLILGAAFFGNALITSNNTSGIPTPTTSVVSPKIETTANSPTITPETETLDTTGNSNLKPTSEVSGDKYYINSDGNKIQSPTYSQDGGVPAGGSARCRDGTYSFSQHRSGTCSSHGGVAEWL